MKKLFSQLNRAEINIPVTILWFALAVAYIGGLFVPLFDDDSPTMPPLPLKCITGATGHA